MPYQSVQELPENVKENLPKHAQEIYQKAFNSAYEEYKDPDERRGDQGRDEVASKVAWSAVKKEYHKEGDRWVRD